MEAYVSAHLGGFRRGHVAQPLRLTRLRRASATTMAAVSVRGERGQRSGFRRH